MTKMILFKIVILVIPAGRQGNLFVIWGLYFGAYPFSSLVSA